MHRFTAGLKAAELHPRNIGYIKRNDPSLEGPLSVPFIVQYVNRNLQVDWMNRRKGTNLF